MHGAEDDGSRLQNEPKALGEPDVQAERSVHDGGKPAGGGGDFLWKHVRPERTDSIAIWLANLQRNIGRRTHA